MRKPKGKFLIFILVILFYVLLPIAIIKQYTSEDNYMKNGIEVDCTVVEIVRAGKRQQVKASYLDESGNVVYADAIMNKSASVGESFKGKILPDKPDKIYREPSLILLGIFGGLILVIWIAIAIGIVNFIRRSRTYKLLKKKGIHTKGYIISVNRLETDCLVKVSFKCEDGTEIEKELLYERGILAPCTDCNVIYYKKPSGKCIAALDSWQH